MFDLKSPFLIYIYKYRSFSKLYKKIVLCQLTEHKLSINGINCQLYFATLLKVKVSSSF